MIRLNPKADKIKRLNHKLREAMGTKCAPLVAELFLYCYKSQFMAKLHNDPSRTDLIDKYNNTHRYLDVIFSVNNSDFYKYTTEIYPTESTLNKANNSLKFPFPDLDVYISQGKISTIIYDNGGDFSYPIINIPFPLVPSYGIYISQFVPYARVCSDVSDFNGHRVYITDKF